MADVVHQLSGHRRVGLVTLGDYEIMEDIVIHFVAFILDNVTVIPCLK